MKNTGIVSGFSIWNFLEKLGISNYKNKFWFIILEFTKKYPKFLEIPKLNLKIPRFILEIRFPYTEQNSGIFRILYKNALQKEIWL